MRRTTVNGGIPIPSAIVKMADIEKTLDANVHNRLGMATTALGRMAFPGIDRETQEAAGNLLCRMYYVIFKERRKKPKTVTMKAAGPQLVEVEAGKLVLR